MDGILSTFSASELEKILSVLNRDKSLRDREKERVTKLGNELVREKRQGALIVNGSQQKSSRSLPCARCQRSLPTIARIKKSQWRCCICRHLVCKACRVIREISINGDLKELVFGSESNIIQPRNVVPPIRKAASVHLSSDNRDADASSSESNNSPLKQFNGRNGKQKSGKDERSSTVCSHDSKSANNSKNILFRNGIFPEDNLLLFSDRTSLIYKHTSVKTLAEQNRQSITQSQEIFKDPCVGLTSSSTEERSNTLTDQDSEKLLWTESEKAPSRVSSISNLSSTFAENDATVPSSKESSSNENDLQTKTQTSSSETHTSSCDEIQNSGGEVDGGEVEKVDQKLNSNSTETDREAMLRFLSMAGVKSSQLNKTPLLPETKPPVSGVTPKKNFETSFFSSTPIKALSYLSQTPLERATNLFAKSLGSNLTFSSLIKSKLKQNDSSSSLPKESKPLLEITNKDETGFEKSHNKSKFVVSNTNQIIENQINTLSSLNSEHEEDFQDALNKITSEIYQTIEEEEKEKTWESLVQFSNQRGMKPYKMDYTKSENKIDFETGSDTSNDEEHADVEDEHIIHIIRNIFLPVTSLKFQHSRSVESHDIRLKKFKTIKMRQTARHKRRERVARRKQCIKNRSPSTIASSVFTLSDDSAVNKEFSSSNSLNDGKRTKSMLRRSLSATTSFVFSVSGFAKNKPEDKKETTFWVCRVCHKTMDLQKKNGEWFHRSATESVLRYKETLFDNSDSPARSRSSTLPLNQTPDLTPFNPVASDNAERRRSADALDSREINEPIERRDRAHTLQDFSHRQLSSHFRTINPRKKLARRTVSEAFHDSLRKYVSSITESETDVEAGVPERCHNSDEDGKEETSAAIVDKPEDCDIIRGFPISLCGVFKGSPPLKITWKKGKNEIQHSSACTIERTSRTSVLTIPRSEPGDSGSYILQVSNSFGFDQCLATVRVVDLPVPPTKPLVKNVSGEGLFISWRSGSEVENVTNFTIEIAKVPDEVNKTYLSWSNLSTTSSKTYMADNLHHKSCYVFRVSAFNDYGSSSPSEISDPVRYLATNQNNDQFSSNTNKNMTIDHVTITKGQMSNYYTLKETVYKGKFGDLHRAVNRGTGEQFAVKIISTDQEETGDLGFCRLNIIKQLRHKNVIQLIDAYQQEHDLALVLEWVSGSMIFEHFIDNRIELTEIKVAEFSQQICDGLEYIHHRSIALLNLEPKHIMVTNKAPATVKLTGFGAAQKLPATRPLQEPVLSSEFAAPEIIEKREAVLKTDMWSFGIICYLMLFGKNPFAKNASLRSNVHLNFDDKEFDHVSDDAKDFLSNLIATQAEKRLSSQDASSHSWFTTHHRPRVTLDTKNLIQYLNRYKSSNSTRKPIKRLASFIRPNFGSHSNRGEDSSLFGVIRGKFGFEKNEDEIKLKEAPIFLEVFDDMEVDEGSVACFRCVINAIPSPSVEWLKDSRVLKDSSKTKMIHSVNDVCTLTISDVAQTDEAEYMCRASNSEGVISHCAELIVIGANL